MITEQQIRDMEPGRELDALVAKHVMGWTKGESWGGINWVDGNKNTHYEVTRFNPSQEIKVAWEVVELMRDLHPVEFEVAMYDLMNPDRKAFQIPPIKIIWRMNPLSICKCALIAILRGGSGE